MVGVCTAANSPRLFRKIMLSLSFGGIVFPTAPLLLLLSVTLAAWVARAASHLVWNALWVGLLVARLGYVLWHNEAFLTPINLINIIDIRDGGWLTPLGWIGAGIYMAWHGWRTPTTPVLQRAIIYSALTGIGLWLAGQGVLRWMDSTKMTAPAVMLQAFSTQKTQKTQTLPQILAGKPTVVNIWATWCPPCRAEMPTLVQAQQNQSDVQIVLVNQGESDAVIAAYLQRSGLDKQNIQNIWRDSSGSLGPALGAAGLPTTVFFNAQGERVDAHTGVLSAAVLQVQMQRLRRENTVRTP